MANFTAGIGLAVSLSSDQLVRCFFSSSGTTWTQFDSLSNIKRPVQIAAIGETWFLATAGSMVYVFGQKLDSVSIPGNPVVVDLVARGTDLVATTDQGVYYSKDAGMQWKKILSEGLGSMFVYETKVFCVSTSGVKRINIDADNVESVGTWSSPITPPVTLDIDAYRGSLYTLAHGEKYQLYRLETDSAGKEKWVKVAYPLPGTKANISTSVMAIDAGTVILSHQLVEGFTDSAGVYAYDLNDFTSVDDESLAANAAQLVLRLASNGFVIETAREEPADILVVDVLGRVLLSQQLVTANNAFITIPFHDHGFYAVLVTYRDNTYQRGRLVY